MPSDNGIVTIASKHSVAETVSRLEQLLQTKGVKVFAVIDHSGEAARAGLQMPDTKLIIFGNPKAGTPLMLAAPSIAIDLPMKILVREVAQDHVLVSYNNSTYLGNRHGLPPDLLPTLASVGALADNIAN
jgi:uncharacterized protein (DUF302 family)